MIRLLPLPRNSLRRAVPLVLEAPSHDDGGIHHEAHGHRRFEHRRLNKAEQAFSVPAEDFFGGFPVSSQSIQMNVAITERMC